MLIGELAHHHAGTTAKALRFCEDEGLVTAALERGTSASADAVARVPDTGG